MHRFLSPSENNLRLARERFAERHANTQNAFKQYAACVEAENVAYLEMVNAERTRDELSEYELLLLASQEAGCQAPREWAFIRLVTDH